MVVDHLSLAHQVIGTPPGITGEMGVGRRPARAIGPGVDVRREAPVAIRQQPLDFGANVRKARFKRRDPIEFVALVERALRQAGDI